MSEEVEIYGFGSFFGEHAQFQDVDILIIHRNGEYKSCQFAIRCKRGLMSKIAKADVTILSANEEQKFFFIEKSNARHIGKVCEVSAEYDLQVILNKIEQFNCFRDK